MTKDSLVRIPSLVDTLRKCRKFTSCRDIRKLATDIVLILTHMFVDPNLNPDAQLESPTSGEELWFKNFKKESEKFLKENKEWAQLLKERLASGGGGSRRRSLNTYESQKLSSPPPAKRARVEEESPPAAVQAVPASQSVMVGVENQPEVSLPVESAENTPEERGDLSLDTANNSGQSGSAPDEDVVLPDVKESEESSIAAAQQVILLVKIHIQ